MDDYDDGDGLGDDDEDRDDEDGQRGAAAVICFSPAAMRAAGDIRFFDDVGAALEAAQDACGDEACLLSHTVAFRDRDGSLRTVSAFESDPTFLDGLHARLNAQRFERRRARWRERKRKQRRDGEEDTGIVDP